MIKSDYMMLGAFLLTAVFILVGANPASACSCDGTSSVAEEFTNASAVFAGRLVGAEYKRGIRNETREMMKEIDGGTADYEVLTLRFSVERWWKGGHEGEVVIVTDQTRAPDGSTTVSDCEYDFEKNKTYLIYAFDSNGNLATGTCTRTAELKRAKKDIKVLGEGRMPAAR